MVRLVAVDGAATVDVDATAPGRGTYACSPECLARLDRRALSRALRTDAALPQGDPLRWPSHGPAL